MKITFLTLLAALALCVSPVGAIAGEEEKVEHYAGAKFKTTAEAKKAVLINNAEIKGILSAEKLTDGQFERIHEITYTLENALPKLKSKSPSPAIYQDAANALEALHKASEHDEQQKAKEAFNLYHEKTAEFVK